MVNTGNEAYTHIFETYGFVYAENVVKIVENIQYFLHQQHQEVFTKIRDSKS